MFLSLFCSLALSGVFDVPEAKPLDDLIRELRAAKTPKVAKLVHRTYEALEKGQLTKVLSLSETIKKNDLYRDYGLFFKASAHLQIANRAALKKHWKTVRSNADKATNQLFLMDRERPRSPFMDSEQPLLLAQADFYQGLAKHAWGNHLGAQESIERGIRRIPGKKLLSQLPLGVIKAYAKSCAKKRGRYCPNTIRWLLRKYPKNSLEAQELKERIHWTLDIPKAPHVDYLTTTYRSQGRDKDAFDEILKEEFLEGDCDDSIEEFRDFLEEFPKSKLQHRAWYLIGYCMKKEGDEEEAREIFLKVLREGTLSYYGLLSAYELGETPDKFIDVVLPKGTTTDPYLGGSELRSLTRAQELLSLKNSPVAQWDLRSLKSRKDVTEEYLTYQTALQSMAGNHLQGFFALSELIARRSPSVMTSFMVRKVFPLEFVPIINQWSKTRKIDPILVIGLIKQESGFMKEAISYAGAMGPMQIMPYTAVDIDPKVPQTDLIVPEVSIRMGTDYLEGLWNRFDKNLVLVMSGYNAGPHRAKKWKAEAKPEWDMTQFIEAIPFTQTRDYCQSIIRNYYWYTYLYLGKRLPNLKYFWGEAELDWEAVLPNE